MSKDSCRCGWQCFMAFMCGILLFVVAFAGYEVYQFENHPARFFARTVFTWLTS